MNRFSFPYPVKPWRLTQGWGIFNPAYQQFGFTRHNGIDVAMGHDKLIRAPFAGTVIRIGNQPNGGGIFISVLSDAEYSFDDGRQAYVLVDFLHCERTIAKEGQVSFATALAIADNTGFSTGSHTHIQLRRVKKVFKINASDNSYRTLDQEFVLQDVDTNDANNSFDPTPYYSQTFAIDDAISVIQQKIKNIQDWIRQFRRSRINDWAKAIAQFENSTKHYPTHNNPGALRWSYYQSGNERGFAMFKTVEDGWKALEYLLTTAASGKSISYRPTDSLYTFFSKYAPSADNNNPRRYAEFVAGVMDISPETQIKELL